MFPHRSFICRNKGKTQKICVVIPAFNEEKSIGDLVEILKKRNFDVIVVDDHSTDLTYQLALKKGAYVIQLPKNYGPGFATKVGLLSALLRSYDLIIKIDGDRQFDERDIDVLLNKLSSADMVIGERLSLNEIPVFRRFGIQLLSLLSSIVVFRKIPDSQSGIYAFKRNALIRLCYEWNPRWGYVNEIVFEAFYKRTRVVYTPVRYTYKVHHRKSYIRLYSYIPRLLYILFRSLIRGLSGFYNYPWIIYHILPKRNHMLKLYFSRNFLVRKYFWSRILEALKLTPPYGFVLELGCGEGLLVYLLNGSNLRRYVGIDIHSHLGEVKKCMCVLREDLKEKVEFIRADAENLPLKTHFDRIYAISILEHFSSKEKLRQCLDEISSHLSQEGVLTVGIPSEGVFYRIVAWVFRKVTKTSPDHHINSREIQKELRELFKNSDNKKVFGGLYIVSSWSKA